VKDDQLKITDKPYKDEHNILQIPTNQGHLTITVCADRAGINPKTIYSRLVRTRDAWSRDDILAKQQAQKGGGYRDDKTIQAMYQGLAPRRGIETIKVGSWEGRNL
jgi:hypothetical protein